MLFVEQYPFSVISLATDGTRFPEQVIVGKESITLVLRSQSCGKNFDSNVSAKFFKASLNLFILILKASQVSSNGNQERRWSLAYSCICFIFNRCSTFIA